MSVLCRIVVCCMCGIHVVFVLWIGVFVHCVVVEEFWISPTRFLVFKKQQFSFEKFFPNRFLANASRLQLE